MEENNALLSVWNFLTIVAAIELFFLVAAILIGGEIMSAISEFAVRQNAANDRLDSAVGRVEVGIRALKDAVVAGGVSAADVAILDAQATRSESSAVRVEVVNTDVPVPTV